MNSSGVNRSTTRSTNIDGKSNRKVIRIVILKLYMVKVQISPIICKIQNCRLECPSNVKLLYKTQNAYFQFLCNLWQTGNKQLVVHTLTITKTEEKIL